MNPSPAMDLQSPTPEAGPPDLSFIITCYFEEQTIDEFYTRLSDAARALGRSYEIVFINDGSTDRTYEKLCGFFDTDPYVTTVGDMFRNSGQLAAMTAGLTHARGNAFIFMDSDLQLDPAELPLLVDEYDKGYDIVSGRRMDRKDTFFRRLSSKFANSVMRRIARHDLHDFGCTYKIYDAKLIRAFEFGPFKTFRTAYIFARAGRCKEVPVTHSERKHGSSGWSIGQLSSFYLDHLVGLSSRPFQALSLFCILLAIVFTARILLAWTVEFSVLPQVTPGLLLNVAVLQFLVTIGALAVIGEYVLRNFGALQRFPQYVIRELRQKPAPGEPTTTRADGLRPASRPMRSEDPLSEHAETHTP